MADTHWLSTGPAPILNYWLILGNLCLSLAPQSFERFPGVFGVLRVVMWLLRPGVSLCSAFTSVLACSLFGCSCARSSKAAKLMVLADGTREESFSDTPWCPLQCTLWSTVPDHQLQGDKEPMCFFFQPSFYRTVAFWQRDEAREMCRSNYFFGGMIKCAERADCPNKGQCSNTAAEHWRISGAERQKMSNGDKELKARENELLQQKLSKRQEQYM